MATSPRVYLLAALVVATGCGGDETTDEGTGPPVVEAVCTEPAEVACVDQMIVDLGLQDTVTDGKVKTRTKDADFITSIDATAGGIDAAATSPWVYVKFTPEGAERVNIDDETALESMDWDLAARRFVIRLNGGSSGPSCVGAAPFLELSYDELTELDPDAKYLYDDFYSGSCQLINDTSGLPGSPQVALGKWWEYPGSCVATTGIPFQVQLADGHVIKLEVTQYYGSGQADCNNNDVMGSDSANLELRWTYLL